VDANGLSVFDLLRYRQHDGAAVLCAFDLIELEGKDLRGEPIEKRKHTLANMLYGERDGIIFNQHYDGDGAIIYKQACKLGCEGIVSKRLGYPYRSGRVDHWLKIKNPAAPAVKREAEEDWAPSDWRGAPDIASGAFGSLTCRHRRVAQRGWIEAMPDPKPDALRVRGLICPSPHWYAASSPQNGGYPRLSQCDAVCDIRRGGDHREPAYGVFRKIRAPDRTTLSGAKY
jgi:ATP dependent DNA ligase domain